MSSTQKLEAFRASMEKNELDAYFIITGDPHSSEMPSDHDARRGFISNFTGSAGNALITKNNALLWTDGRYFLQAEQQLDDSYWKLMKAGLPDTPTTAEYLAKSTDIKTVGFDVMCMPTQYIQTMKKKAQNIQFVPFYTSLVDTIWENQPPYPSNPVYVFDKKYAGVDTPKKIENMKKEMATQQCSAIFLSQLDEVAWTTNLRGDDMTESPHFYSYFLITENESILFVNESKLTEEATNKMKEENIQIKPYDSMVQTLSNMNFTENSKIWLDPTINFGVYSLFNDPEKIVYLKDTPVNLAKAKKNEAERKGMIDAHHQDGMAMAKFFTWLEEKTNDKSIFEMNEYQVAQTVNNFRAQQSQFIKPSFSTICGSGANGAIIHYSPQSDKCSLIQPKMLLIDSGGQFESGTTDVTRTTHLGTPTEEEKTAYTAVLKGHIALACIFFRSGTKGSQLDILARQFLWAEGLEYTHGTGHGVGAFANVHEGPCNISPSITNDSTKPALDVGMIISNEPGFYYFEKEFGIRIENLVMIEKAQTPNKYNNLEFFNFKTITKIPIDTNIIDFSKMSSKEIDWLNNYHKDVANEIIPLLEEEQKTQNIDNSAVINWIQRKTQPVST